MHVPTIITRRQNPVNFRQHVIENCTLTLNHACNCHIVNCPVDHCGSMKRVWKHVLSCNKSPENCQVCKNFQTLVGYHSRLCQNTSCNVVFCSAIRKRRYNRSQLLNHQEKQQKFQGVASLLGSQRFTAFPRKMNRLKIYSFPGPRLLKTFFYYLFKDQIYSKLYHTVTEFELSRFYVSFPLCIRENRLTVKSIILVSI